MSEGLPHLSRFHLAGRREELVNMNVWLEAFATACDLPAAAAFHLDLVLTEAVTNVIDYAGAAEGDLSIDLVCELKADSVSVEITDNGRAFNPTGWEEAPPPASLEEATPGGLGIHLIRKFTRSMQYRRHDGCNVLTLTVPLVGGTSAEAAGERPAPLSS
jgi:anti-sigma regulatory factor (Ser/Thr protein kinase)